ncbi:GAF domain-containing protein [Leptobacterium flavescens]|uniref:GAF domain-containing protein n=1 Tax=Leptobacterium flavescens TaxID=472055 RepID=A0A6P0UMY7_9FLAO|nr:GAF domain-containing protein [Leptobacterium flavescens]NER14634.1 GAF domain-containing protein [Leptobacterium flavescens]
MLDTNNVSPLSVKISFNKLLEVYEKQAGSKDELRAKKAQKILAMSEQYPELRDGFSDVTLLDTYKNEISYILQDSFSDVLTGNEIKAASIPFQNLIFNTSSRFEKILDTAGKDFELKIRNMPEGHMYILACIVILKFHYKIDVDFKRPLYYDIPDAKGIMRHYRIIYNADFTEIVPTEEAKEITDEDVDQLLENFDNLELWKEKFPPNSWVCKGFVISNIFDVTADVSISDLKSTLLGSSSTQPKDENFIEEFEAIFQSLFNIPDLKVGFVAYDPEEDSFEKIHGEEGVQSYLLFKEEKANCTDSLCQNSYSKLLKENQYYALPDIDKYYKMSGGIAPYKNLKEQGYKSAILAPIADKGRLLGVLELVSTRPKELNSINANKLIDVMPFIISTVLRSKAEEENYIEAIIQHECTSIHNSVYWRFEKEARRFLMENAKGNQTSFKEIAFKDVYPLYGQVDIKGSSIARNEAIQTDLIIQLSLLNEIFSCSLKEEQLPVYEEIQFRINNHLSLIKEELFTHSEQTILDFVREDVHPVLEHIETRSDQLSQLVKDYRKNIDNTTGGIYDHRKNYDESVTLINKSLARVIDEKQRDAQAMFPHYFERYKTDGVEHNMYIGASMVQGGEYHPIYLNNLRLWQLQVMCEMENKYYNLKPELPVKLDVASMLLVYNSSLSIRFRMDEKRFDVDGTYNARYEIIKKRLDKSLVKGTKERLTQPGKIAIVYSQKKDEREYLRYISFLQSKNYFTSNVEIVELEGLQGVSGLKAIRAEVLYKKGGDEKKVYTYDDLMQELKIS